ncbi:MAG: radical SAM protein [Ruminiclostridium sp.]|nr:radical SAM protein [Ruminiclostridium sp.]
MNYLLQPDYRLLGWKGEPFYLARRSTGITWRLSPAEFAFLLRCDGETEMEPDEWPPVPAWAVREKIIAECVPGERLLPEQAYRLYPNRKMDYMELSLTGRCNLNCKHCFNAADCNPRTVEPTLEQLWALLGNLADCGVCRMRLNGGEPLTRKDFLTITGEMAKLGIVPYEIITNGVLITPELLDKLEKQGHRPIWFVSFDGLGHHDWLRGVPGTEEKVLKNIRLLCDRGYYVHVHQCVWKDSLSSIRPTVLRIKEMGVSRYRLVTVEPSLRWRETAPEQTVSTEEWLRFLPDFLDWWYENDIDLDLDVWSYWVGSRGSRSVTIVPDLFSRGEDNRTLSCPEYPNRAFIDADGRMVRCMPLSGGTAGLGIPCPNVYQEDDVQQVMTQSNFLTDMTCTCLELKRQNPECLSCPWFDRCGMGCRAEALTQGLPDRVSLTGIDRRMCLFFNSGCYEKLKAVAEKHGLKYTV